LGQVAPVAVYTSATLAQGGDFGYFMQRAGIEPHAAGLVVPSPFDYEKQCLVVQGQFLGEHDDPGFAPQAAELLSAIVRRCGRRTLVLLTSYAALRRLHAELTRRLGARAPVFAQEISGGRAQLAARFAATPSAVLLGSASFWQGIDFPGSALEILAIAKLPFLVPEEPLVAARCARLRRHGEDPFTGYVLPEAVLRFKQGFGRLVRSGSDRGVVLLLDSRLGERGYGAEFLAALPVAPEVFDTAAALVDRVAGWLEEHGTR
jgi:ATP-dependent DNA helicase DinG